MCNGLESCDFKIFHIHDESITIQQSDNLSASSAVCNDDLELISYLCGKERLETNLNSAVLSQICLKNETQGQESILERVSEAEAPWHYEVFALCLKVCLTMIRAH